MLEFLRINKGGQRAPLQVSKDGSFAPWRDYPREEGDESNGLLGSESDQIRLDLFASSTATSVKKKTMTKARAKVGVDVLPSS